MAGVQGPPGVRGPPLAAPRVQDFERKVGRSLSECMSQVELDFESKGLGGDGAQVLAYILTQSDKLTNLRICHTGIGDEGGKAIGKALEVNSSMRDLNLTNNRIDAEGAKAISKTLEVNSTHSDT